MSSAIRSCLILFLASSLLSLLIPAHARSAEVTLTWDESPSPSVTGYYLYYGTSSGDYPQGPIDAGGQTTHTVPDLDLNRDYYFVATAHDDDSHESTYSNEIRIRIDDSDSDGLSDTSETETYLTDPNDPDSDDDGTSDGDEVAYWADNSDGTWNGDLDGDGTNNLHDPDPYNSSDTGEGSQDNGSGGTSPGSENSAPVASTSPDQTVDEGVKVILDASNSHDPDGDTMAYEWTQTSGPAVALSSSTAMKPSFTSPEVASEGVALTFEVTVTDEHGASASDTTIVNVTWSNDPPTAVTGENQTVSSGDVVDLDGSQSTDPDDGIASTAWTQTGGTQVQLSDALSSRPSFIAPEGGTTLTFKLVVEDNQGLRDSATCTVQVEDIAASEQPPVADAGQKQQVLEGTTVTLNGLASSDPNSDLQSYSWTQLNGPAVTLSDPASYSPYFVTPSVDDQGAELEFKLKVTDASGLSSVDTVKVQVTDNGVDLGNQVPDHVLPLPHYEETHNAGVAASSESALISIDLIEPGSIDNTSNKPAGQSYPLFYFELKVQNPGDTAEVTFFFDHPLPKDYVWYKYDSQKGWDVFENCQFSKNKKEVTLTLVDGGTGDTDAMANGIIVDPSGPGLDSPGEPTLIDQSYPRALTNYFNEIGYTLGNIAAGTWDTLKVEDAVLQTGVSLQEHLIIYGRRPGIVQKLFALSGFENDYLNGLASYLNEVGESQADGSVGKWTAANAKEAIARSLGLTVQEHFLIYARRPAILNKVNDVNY